MFDWVEIQWGLLIELPEFQIVFFDLRLFLIPMFCECQGKIINIQLTHLNATKVVGKTFSISLALTMNRNISY